MLTADILEIRKAHMDQIFDQAKVEISPTLKAWEPQRQYEKKLHNVMNKDKSRYRLFVVNGGEFLTVCVSATEGRRRRRDKGTASAGELTSADEESEGEKLVDTDGEQAKTSRPKARPIRGTRHTRANPNPEEEIQDLERNDINENEQDQDQTLATPKPDRVRTLAETPPPAPSRDVEASVSQATADVGTEPEPEATQQQPSTPRRTSVDREQGETVNELIETPKASTTKKRSREDEDREASPRLEPQEEEAAEQPSTPVDEVYIRRKRIRL